MCAGEFYIPKLNPLNKKYPYDVTNPNRFRDYGAWDAYARTYPKKDLVYKVKSLDCDNKPVSEFLLLNPI
jgi:hypothetical protein